MSDITGLDTVIMGIEAYVAALTAGALAAAHEITQVLEDYAKANHPWHNRTGDTEESTKGVVASVDENEILILVLATSTASQFLELCHDGRWAWLHAAVLACEDQIREILIAHCGSVG